MNFLNFFVFFLEFSITRWVGTKRNDNFYFLYFSAFSNLFWLEMKPQWYYLIFWLFFVFFFEFFITRRVWTEWKGNFYFFSFSAFFNLFWLEMKPYWYCLVFRIFLLFFWNFLLRVGWERNDTTIFIFSICQPIPTYFRLKRSHYRVF